MRRKAVALSISAIPSKSVTVNVKFDVARPSSVMVTVEVVAETEIVGIALILRIREVEEVAAQPVIAFHTSDTPMSDGTTTIAKTNKNRIYATAAFRWNCLFMISPFLSSGRCQMHSNSNPHPFINLLPQA